MSVSVIRGLVVFLLCSLSAACTTIDEKKELNKSGYSNEPLPLIFEKNIKKTGFSQRRGMHQYNIKLCGFYEDELLYLYYPTRGEKIVVYDKKSGLFTVSDFESNQRLNFKSEFKCSDYSIRLSDKLDPNLHYSNSIKYYVLSNSMRSIFDNASKNPEAFKEEINLSDPPFFELLSGGSTKRPVQVGYTDRRDGHDYLGDIKSYYKNLSTVKADRLINPVLAKIAEEQAEKERKEREEKFRIELFELEQRIAQERWDNRLGAKYSIGDKVCTYDTNSFGYIEDLNTSKMKIHVVGQADRENGFFFSGIDGNFNYKKVEAIRWFDRNELAHCNFN